MTPVVAKLAILAIFQTFIPVVENANILFLIPMSTISEKHFFVPLYKQLASNGHKLTVVTNIADSSIHENITEIVPISAKEIYGEFADISNPRDIFWDLVFLDVQPYMKSIDNIYQHPEVQKLSNEKYDLIFTNLFFGQAFYGLIYRYQCPFILLHSFPVTNYFLKDWGMYMPPSHIPYPMFDYTDKMDFAQRLVNLVVDWAVYFQVEFYQIPLYESAYRNNIAESHNIPSVKEIHKSASLTMMNTHFLANYHRPLMPDVIEVGGLHCKDAKPLPQDLETLVGISAAPHGFIFISFGTVVKASTLSDEIRQKFVNVFSRLKQKVVWKWESDEATNFPPNIILRKWLPQQDLLGHENIRLFISHGGLLSTQQTIFHGVPAIMFPLYFDQPANAKGFEQQGGGLNMNIWNFTEAELETGINKMIQDKKFKSRVKLLSEVFRDQMNTPLERAIFWTNHVIKYNGAPHLRSSARDLNFIQLHSIDVIGFLLGSLIIAILLVIFFIKTLLKYLRIVKNNPRKDKML